MDWEDGRDRVVGSGRRRMFLELATAWRPSAEGTAFPAGCLCVASSLAPGKFAYLYLDLAIVNYSHVWKNCFIVSYQGGSSGSPMRKKKLEPKIAPYVNKVTRGCIPGLMPKTWELLKVLANHLYVATAATKFLLGVKTDFKISCIALGNMYVYTGTEADAKVLDDLEFAAFGGMNLKIGC
ncbi:hypothetical protein EJB05_34772, partial [Eragrostis curvula]